MMLPPIFGFVRYFSWIVGDFCGFSCASVTLLRRSREVRMALPTRCEDSTAAVEVRRADCRWAFVFSDAGDPQMCDRHARSRATRSRWGQRKAKTGTKTTVVFSPDAWARRFDESLGPRKQRERFWTLSLLQPLLPGICLCGRDAPGSLK